MFNKTNFHFTDQSICHCYADLKPFHCEEEQGVDLVPVMCLEKIRPPSPLNRPIFGFGFGSRRPMPRSQSSPTTSMKNTTAAKQQIERRKYKLLTTFNSKNATATSTSVLVILALIAIISLMAKTYVENKKKSAKRKTSSESNVTTISVVSQYSNVSKNTS